MGDEKSDLRARENYALGASADQLADDVSVVIAGPVTDDADAQPVGEDQGADSFNDFLAIVSRCLPAGADAFTQAAYLWAGLHGRVALGDAIPSFPWPTEDEYVERILELHINAIWEDL